jgi:predicted SAM-dependent methyltransferase
MERERAKLMLNAGSGAAAGPVREAFDPSVWQEVRIDLDPETGPDLVGSIADMRGLAEDKSFDAVWCSHCLEHLYDHQTLPALREFRRILADDGFAIISCPDLEAVAKQVVSEDVESVAYLSPAGPIRLLDMIFGHSVSVENGHAHMAHKTGFTADRLGRLAMKAGFAEARVRKGENYDLWAALRMPGADLTALASLFEGDPIAGLFSDSSAPPAIQDTPRGKRVRILRI